MAWHRSSAREPGFVWACAALILCWACVSEEASKGDLSPQDLRGLLESETVPAVTEPGQAGAGDLQTEQARSSSKAQRQAKDKGAIPSKAIKSGDPFARFRPESEMSGDPFSEFSAEMGPEGTGEATLDVPELPVEELEVPHNPLSSFDENPYLSFGRRIKIYPDGTITKPYPLRPGTGKKMQELIQSYGNFPLWTAEMGDGPSPPNMVKIDLLEGWDVELVQDMRNAKDGGNPVPVADWLVVTCGEDLLWEVEEFINLFAAGVPQIEIEAKIVEITFSESLEYGVNPGSFIFPENTFVDTLDFGLSSVGDNNINFGALSLGAVQDGVAFNAVIEAIAGNENVSIISRPKVAVREGARAQLLSTERIPFLEVTNFNDAGGFNTKLNYFEIGVQMYVVPRVVGTDTVALDIDIEASQQGADQVVAVADNEEITVPILSTRQARTVVYLRPGQAVILGGLINERSVDRVRKVPLLGDIPIIKHLFRSRFKAKEQSNVLFFIRPRILQGSDLSRDF